MNQSIILHHLQFWEEFSEEISGSSGISRELTEEYADDFIDSLEEHLKKDFSWSKSDIGTDQRNPLVLCVQKI